MRILRTAFGLTTFAAAAYGAYAAFTFLSYGSRKKTRPSPSLDRFIPEPEVIEQHSTHVDAPAALAYETVPQERATLAWLLKRSFRAGQSHGAQLISRGRRVPNIALASVKAAACSMAAVLLLPEVKRRNRYLTRAALHCGVVARLAGYAEIKLY